MNTIEKTFAILEEIVSHQDTGITFSEIARHHHLPKSTTHRILKILINLRYVFFDQNAKKYYGSLKLSKLASQVIDNFDLRTFIHPHLLKLHEKTKHTCHLGIINQNVGIYLDKVESRDYGIKLFSEIGKEFPLHCTAMGKVLLAFADPPERSSILKGGLHSFTSNTITKRSLLGRELKLVQKNGVAVDREEITRGIMCISAPIRNYRGKVLAAISVTFPSYIKDERGLDFEIEAVKDAAVTISSIMGGTATKEEA